MSTQTATLRTRSCYDCLLHVPGSQKWKQFLHSQQHDVTVVEMSWSTSRGTHSAYFSVSPKLLYSKNTDQVEIDPLFAAAINVTDNQQVCVQVVKHSVVPCKAVSVVPASTDDIRVCEQNKDYIMDNLRDQIRVVQPNFSFTLFNGHSVLCPKLEIVKVEPTTAPCALLIRDTAVEILHSVPMRTLSRSMTAPAPSDKNSTSRGLSNIVFSYLGLMGGLTKQESQYHKPVDRSGDSGIQSGPDSEVSTPNSRDRTPETSPIAWDHDSSYVHSIMSWFNSAPQPAKNSNSDSAVDPLSTRKGEAPNGLKFKGRHTKQASSPFPLPLDRKLLPEYINTPPMNVILRIQPYRSASISFVDNVRQLDVYVHPWTFPSLYLKRKSVHDIPSYLVKLQAVFPLEKPSSKKTNKNEQGDDDVSQQPQPPSVQKGIIKAVVVRLCFTALYYPGSNVLKQKSQLDPAYVKPGHIVVSDCVRQQLGIRDFSRVRLTEVIENMRLSCNGHSIQLTLLDKKEGMTKEALHDSFQSWLNHVGQYSLFGAPLVYHMVLSLPTQQEDQFCNVELKLTAGSTVRRKELPVSDDAPIKNIDFVLLEDRDLTSSRVTLNTVIPDPVKAIPKPSVTDNTNGEVVVMPDLSQIKEPFLLEPHQQLGGVDEYVTAGLNWITVALEKQLTMDKLGHGVSAGSLLVCAKSNSGHAGCGITSVAKEICYRATNYPLLAHVIVMECASHRGRAGPFKDALHKKFTEARWFQPSIILLDDLDHIAPNVQDTRHDHGEGFNSDRMSEIVQDLLIEEIKYGSSVIVMATAQSTTSLNAALLPSRGSHVFRKIIEISPPTLGVRQEILQVIVNNKHLHHGLSKMDWKKVCCRMEGYLVKDLVNIVERAIHNQDKRISSHDKTLVSRKDRDRSVSVDTPRPKELNSEDFMKAIEGYKPLALRSVPLHKPEDITFDSVGGLDHVKATLVEAIQWPAKYPKLFSSFKLKQRSGLLLYGAPGTGKTMIAKALGKEFGLNFISIKGPELLNKYIGASEQAVRDVFIRAHSAKPCILFFDEFDALAPQRGHDNTGVTDRVVNQLLTQLDGVESLDGVFVLAASSRPDLIDPALLRPGRIDKSLYCELPNQGEQIEILKALSKSLPLSKDVDFHEITNDCQYFTGADLKALLYNAQLQVAHNVLNSEKPESTKKQKALNGMSVGRIWCSANVSREKKDEVAQRVRTIQRIKNSRSKDKQSTTHKQENLLITQSDLLTAVKSLQPSISQKERERYLQLYDSFINKSAVSNLRQQKATLA